MLGTYQTRTPAKPRGRPPADQAAPMPTDQPIVVSVKVVPDRLRCRRCGAEYDAKRYDRRGGGMVSTCRCPKCGQIDLMPRLGS